jgi:hypothetical protein
MGITGALPDVVYLMVHAGLKTVVDQRAEPGSYLYLGGCGETSEE